MTNKVRLLLILGVVLAVIGGGILALIQSRSDGDRPDPSPAPTPTQLETLRDGGFEMVPIRARCGVTEVGSAASSKKPQGTYCVVMLTVKNVTDQPKVFPVAQQRAVTNADQQVSADLSAGDFANGADKTLIQEVAPNTRIAGYVVFDIPRGSTLSKLELRGEPSSPGVTVPIG